MIKEFILCGILFTIAGIMAFTPYLINPDLPNVPLWEVEKELKTLHYEELECTNFSGDFNEDTRICIEGSFFQKPKGLDINWYYGNEKYHKFYSGFSVLGTDDSQCNDGFKYIETDYPETFPTCVNIDYYNSSSECEKNYEKKWYSSTHACTPIPDHDIIINNQEKILDILENKK